MIKLKGGDDKNSILAQTAKRMNLPTLNNKGGAANNSNSFTSPGSHHAQQVAGTASSAIPDGPTPLAQRLGMPSAMSALAADKNSKGKKDWSNSSNRINLGAPVFIQGKTQQQPEEEEQIDDKVKRKPGDVDQDEDTDDDDDLFSSSTGDDNNASGGGSSSSRDPEEQRLLASLRAKRLQELMSTTSKQQQWLALGHGSYTEISQDSFLSQVCSSKYVICHFYHTAFDRCKIIDHHLELLCKQHLPTKFLKINAEKAPFFVQKLQIKVLPTVVLFKDGIAVDRLVGFEDLGGADEFKSSDLEKRLAKSGVLLAKTDADAAVPTKNSIRSGKHGKNLQDEDSGDDEA